MLNIERQQQKAKIFRDLHFGGSLLVLPNIWDPLGAALLEDLGYPAVATASASVAYTHGVPDGENLKFSELLDLLKKIAGGVGVPVTADIESGYADTDEGLQKNIKQVLETGVVGVNLEDYDLKEKKLFSVAAQCHRIKIVRQAAESMGIPLFINARTDVYLRADVSMQPGDKWNETCKRGKAYLDAGADGIYPIMMRDQREISELVSALASPVNILAMPGIPDIRVLREKGVARLSLGPGFLKVAIRAMKQVAVRLKNGEGLPDITDNEISGDYLKKLVTGEG